MHKRPSGILKCVQHRGNASENYNGMPPYTKCWDSINKIWNNKCWQACGKNGTVVHFWWECKLVQLLLKTAWKWKLLSRVQLFVTAWTIQSSLGQNTGVGSLALLEGIFPTQGSNPGLPHCRGILNQLRHKGSQRILEWVAYPFSSWSFWLRNWTGVSCIAGRFFNNWAIKEAR